MSYNKVAQVASVLAFSFLAVTSARSQVLLNGSFESPSTSSSSLSASNWVLGSGGSLVVVNNTFATTDNLGTTPYGSQFAELTQGSTLSQSITGFTAGQVYVLGADFADEIGKGGTFTLAVSGAANISETFTINSATQSGGNEINFQSAVLIFAATSSAPATLSLTVDSLENLGEATVAVDNVALYGGQIRNDSPGAPEPSTWAMMLGGAAMLALGGVRRLCAVRC